MKVVINKTGEVKEVRQREADRLINRGAAHPTKEQKTEPKKLVDIPDEVFEVPKSKKNKRSKKKKSKFKGWKVG